MKLHQISRPGVSLWKPLLVLALGILVTSVPARATLLTSGVNLKSAGRTTQWALFALSGGITITDTTNQTNPAVSSQSPSETPDGVFGAKIGAAGGGSITLSGTSKVVGRAYIKRFGVLRKSGTASITSVQAQNAANDAFMDTVRQDAIDASAQANALADSRTGLTMGSPGGPAFTATSVNQNTPFSLHAPAGSKIVLQLTNFVLTGGAMLTLNGDANTTYIVNVSNNFTLLGGKVALNGGIGWENVLFNVTGVGSDLSLTSASEYRGILLATQRTVNVSGVSKVFGSVVAGKVNISGGSRIVKPTSVSP